MRGISCLAENRLASQEGLCSMEKVSKIFHYPHVAFICFCVILTTNSDYFSKEDEVGDFYNRDDSSFVRWELNFCILIK